mmetsp:Transcript_27596/g.72543  ORF Transcript_27596/g.72543 Transcript_27596/m.72543 type:complete len:95 (-) Transcript_27596:791-1075(-)
MADPPAYTPEDAGAGAGAAPTVPPPNYTVPDGTKKLPIDLVLPPSGIVMAESQTFVPILCKPKILPIKSAAFVKQEQRATEDAEAAAAAASDND